MIEIPQNMKSDVGWAYTFANSVLNFSEIELSHSDLKTEN